MNGKQLQHLVYLVKISYDSYDSKLRVWVFWTVGWRKEISLWCLFWAPLRSIQIWWKFIQYFLCNSADRQTNQPTNLLHFNVKFNYWPWLAVPGPPSPGLHIWCNSLIRSLTSCFTRLISSQMLEKKSHILHLNIRI